MSPSATRTRNSISSRVKIVLVLLLCCSFFAAFNIYVATSEYSSSGGDFVNEVAIPDQHTITTKPSAHEDKNSLAYSQSYGFFDDITDDHWKHLQKRAVEHVNHANPERELVGKSHLWYARNYEPNFTCQFEMRIGGNGNGDGPKWVCDPHRIKIMAARRKAVDPNHPGCVVYSIGSRGDFSFELGLQKEVGEGVCEFHTFDMRDYGASVPKELKRAHFHQWGLKEQDPQVDKPELGQTFYGLLDTIKLLGHENLDVIDIFKIDCEGCEFKTFQDWIGEGIPALHQIQVELHDSMKRGQSAFDLFDSLEKEGYLRFHKEPNLFSKICIEYAFVKVEKEFLQEKILAAARM